MATPHFARNSGAAMLGGKDPDIILVENEAASAEKEGNVFLFKVVGIGLNQHVEVKSEHSCVEIVPGQRNEKGKYRKNDSEQPFTMTVVCKGKAKIYGYINGKPFQSLGVEVLSRIELPPLESDAGVIARLLLAESQGPSSAGFVSLDTTLESMRWMRRVLYNRMEFPNLGAFGIKQKSVRGVISAPGQFEGFATYPQIAALQLKHINNIMKIANDGGDMRFESHRHHVGNALKVANELPSLITDPCPTGLYGWRTTGHDRPGGNYKLYRTYAGQDFYTLTQEFLSSHKAGGKGKP